MVRHCSVPQLSTFGNLAVDFKKTLVLDPANAAAKQELEKVEALLKYRAESLGKVCNSMLAV